MVDNVVNMAWYKATHRQQAAVFPIVVFNAYVDFWNTVTRAWVNVAFNPYL